MPLRKRAGVSPLIAAVLLIAFTLAIGGFLSTWLQDMARTQTEAASQNADAGCAYMNFNSRNATLNASGTSMLVLTLENSGTRNAIINTIRVTGENLNSTVFSHPSNFIGTLNSGDEIMVGLAINRTWIDSIATIRIIPADCPQTAISIKGSEVAHYT